jgi:cyclophilin family peptidyl-prolyl cis-trans isomerase
MAAPLRSLFLALALSASAALAQTNTAPVLDDPVQANRVAPTIPGGRVLLFPVTATDADGDRLSYTVTSSNPRILARVKTGNPFLKFTVTHADGGATDPAYSGDLIFMLLRDWTPITTGFIAGFAQSGFYDGTSETPVATRIFHRLTSLGAGNTGFIFQGGDPLGTGLGGPGMTGNVATTAWKFENELDPALIFVGRGQLAMANSGSGAQVINNAAFGDWRDTNGSQFFITDGQPRHLDFRHTIFAQLVRGWELLPLLRATKTTSSVPDVAVRLAAASVLPTSGANQTDAVLVLSATGAGTATITVKVDDGRGGTATKTFTATAVKETINAPPFLRKVAPVVTPKDAVVFFDLEPTDLEHDFMDTRHFVLQGFPTGGSSSGGLRAGYRPASGDDGLVRMGFDVAQFDVGDQAFATARLSTDASIGVGDRIALGERVTIEGAPGVPFSGVAGKIRDFDPASAPSDFTATINWGDGSPLDSTVTLGRDAAGVGASLLTVSGTHTYARAGIYSVVVNFNGSRGVVGVAHGQAIISAASIRAAGETLEITGATVKGRVLATFSDSASTGTPGDYVARIDWGDGSWSDGVVGSGVGGRFIVRGTHTFRDAERYAIHVRIRRKTDAPGVNEASAWSAVTLAFKATPHLPPFPKPNLTAAWLPVGVLDLTKTFTGLPGPNYAVLVSGNFIIINSGNRTMKQCIIRYWLSDDEVLSKTTDLPVRVRLAGASAFGSQLNLANFAAGVSTPSSAVTLALPRGQSGGRKFIITEMAYPDPLTDVEAIDKVFASPQIDPAFIVIPTSVRQTTESGGTATFTVQLDTPPTADVTIPLVSSVPAEGTVSPAQLVFTTANWNTPQTVTVTGVDDTTKDGTKTFVVQLGAVTSTDSLYSGLNPADVTFTNLDNEP